MALNLQHQTPEQFAARFWRMASEAYRAGDKLKYCKLIWWIWTRIQAGDITSNQVRLAYNSYFGKSLDATQWNTLVTSKFIPLKDQYLALIATEEA